MKTKLISAIVGLLVVCSGLVAYQQVSKKKQPENTQPPVSTGIPASVHTPVILNKVDNSKLPSGIPADLPLDKDSEIIDNSEVTNQDTHMLQSTRTFVTDKTLTYYYSLYTEYLNSHHWEILSTLDQEYIKAVSAKKGDEHLDISIFYNSNRKINIVSIVRTAPVQDTSK